MTLRPLRLACSLVSAALALVAAPSIAHASDKADCTAAQKAAQAEKTSGALTKALVDAKTCARAVCPKPMQKQCGDLATAITASQPTVVFSAKDASGNAVTAVTVSIDGAVVATALDGTPVPVDPGSHALKFESEGATTVEKQTTFDPETKGQAVAIALDVNPPAAPPPIVAVAPAAATPGEPGTMFDTTEDPTKRYYFIGLRYRGNVIPQFMLNIFVNGGKTLYSNSIGAEIDLRHDNFSLIPAISYTEFGSGDVVFSQKGKDITDPGNWSVVNSSLKGIFASADLLWTAHIANHWDFEYGAEFGLGVLFGSLEDNWVFATHGGTVSPTNFTACKTIESGLGCMASDHNNSMVNKVGGYNEPFWSGGGSVPNVFPLINFPQIGIRYKPMKQLESRLGVGFSLTGFWFGLSANYGLEKPTK